MRQRARRRPHPLRLVSRVIVLTWAWRNRHDLLRWGRFALRLPSEVRSRDLDDLVTEARARIALSADPRTRCAGDLDIAGFENGSLLVSTPGQEPLVQVAREVLAGVSGVIDVRVVDNRLPTTTTTQTPEAGSDRPDRLGPPVGDSAAWQG